MRLLFLLQRYFLIVLTIFGTLVYLPSIKYGFSQDDFIHIAASRVSSFAGAIGFFNPLAKFPDIFFYRPLSTQLYFFTNDKLFNLSTFVLHSQGLLFHAM